MSKKNMLQELKLLSPDNCTFSKNDAGLLRVEVKDNMSIIQAVLKRLFPLKHPDNLISVSDGKKEIGIIESLKDFEKPVREMIREDLDHYYAVPEISEVKSITHEYGFYLWKTVTDRGEREFYVKGRTDTLRQTTKGELHITDINNCRYVIPDINTLSKIGKVHLNQVL